MTTATEEERSLIFAPMGRDAEVLAEVLRDAKCNPFVCETVETICEQLNRGVAVVFIAEEGLTDEALQLLSEELRKQPSWSDIPIVVGIRSSEQQPTRIRLGEALGLKGNVTLIERPFRVSTFVSAVEAAIRARRRQYEMRATLEALGKQKAARERFVSILAHDLRGPLSVAKMAAEQIMSTKVSETLAKCARSIVRSVTREDRMITDLVDANRIGSGGGLQLKLSECDLASVAREVAEELNTARGQRVVYQGPDCLTGTWNASQLLRALWNLATNARKYGAAGAQITISASGDGYGVTASVHNEGNPIPPEEQSRVFDEFHRTPSAEQQDNCGWGLGLTLVRGCAEAHGGSVEVASSHEAGTTFTMRLPWDARPFLERRTQ